MISIESVDKSTSNSYSSSFYCSWIELLITFSLLSSTNSDWLSYSNLLMNYFFSNYFSYRNWNNIFISSILSIFIHFFNYSILIANTSSSDDLLIRSLTLSSIKKSVSSMIMSTMYFNYSSFNSNTYYSYLGLFIELLTTLFYSYVD